MAVKDQLLQMIIKNGQRVRKLLDDISESESMERGYHGFNHIRWQVGHMLWGDSYVLTLFEGKYDPESDIVKLFGSGSVISDKASDYPAYAELRDQLFAVYDKLIEAVEKAPDADLEKTVDNEAVWKTITFMMMHDSYHSGQVVHIRKALGRERPFG